MHTALRVRRVRWPVRGTVVRWYRAASALQFGHAARRGFVGADTATRPRLASIASPRRPAAPAGQTARRPDGQTARRPSSASGRSAARRVSWAAGRRPRSVAALVSEGAVDTAPRGGQAAPAPPRPRSTAQLSYCCSAPCAVRARRTPHASCSCTGDCRCRLEGAAGGGGQRWRSLLSHHVAHAERREGGGRISRRRRRQPATASRHVDFGQQRQRPLSSAPATYE